MSIVRKNGLLVCITWLAWLTMVAIEVLLQPYLWLRPLFFLSVALFLITSLVVNLQAFPNAHPEKLQSLNGLFIGLIITAVASIVGVSIAVNFKLWSGGSL